MTNPIRKHYQLVGDLQYYASPYASLYVSDTDRSLYVFVRTSEYSNTFVEGLMAKVSAPIVQLYLSGKQGLTQLLRSGKPRLCALNAEQGTLSWSVPCKNIDNKIPANANVYDDDFCFEQGELSYFLNQYQ